MPNFIDIQPTLENYWRSIILFGRNVASYKFALGKSLLELAKQQKEIIPLLDLAVPFARRLCEHLKSVDFFPHTLQDSFFVPLVEIADH